MKAMLLAFVITIIIAIGAYQLLTHSGYTTAVRTSGDNVRLD